MPVFSLSCPVCDAVMKSPKPIPGGRKVNCLKCKRPFMTPEETLPEPAVEEIEEIDDVEEVIETKVESRTNDTATESPMIEEEIVETEIDDEIVETEFDDEIVETEFDDEIVETEALPELIEPEVVESYHPKAPRPRSRGNRRPRVDDDECDRPRRRR